ncbi:MAG TPA: hypothetical protein VGH49_19865 [Xanthobacteraceae bacterium]
MSTSMILACHIPDIHFALWFDVRSIAGVGLHRENLMVWGRMKRRAGVALGLFALAVQLMASFGHVHPQDFASRSGQGSAVPLVVTEAAYSSAPFGHHVPTGVPDDDCPICVAMHVLASGLLPAAPMATPPHDLGRDRQRAPIEKIAVGPRRFLFQSRAPPLA